MAVINSVKNFIWIWIPKNAGSFVFSHPDIRKGSESMAGNHEKLREIEERVNCDLFFKFCFVRNPYDRIVSAYHHFEKYHNFNCYKNFEEFVLSNFEGEDGHISMANSKTHKSSYRRVQGDKVFWNDHFDTQTSFIEDESGKTYMDFVGKTEKMEQDFSEVCEILGLPEIKNEIKNKTKHEKYPSYFEGKNSNRKIQIVNELYKEDFERFQYEKW